MTAGATRSITSLDPMKLDRNTTNPKRGKYALIKLRDVTEIKSEPSGSGSHVTVWPHSAVDFGDTEDSDFFVIRLKDKYAARALREYAAAAMSDGETEYADEILKLADDAAFHPNRRRPD
jgi:hypothetical protein